MLTKLGNMKIRKQRNGIFTNLGNFTIGEHDSHKCKGMMTNLGNFTIWELPPGMLTKLSNMKIREQRNGIFTNLGNFTIGEHEFNKEWNDD